jgi:hypothetical protein
MAKDIDETRQDRSADRDAIQAQMDEYLRHGGLISKLDWSGKVIGLETEAPSAPRQIPKGMNFNPPINSDRTAKLAPTVPAPASKALPVKKVEFAPIVEIAPAVVTRRVKPAPTATIIDIVPELRRIRAEAQRALARLNAAAERRIA